MEKSDTSGDSNWDTSSSPLLSHQSKSSRSSIKNVSSSTGSLSRLSASSTARMQATLAKADAQAARARLAYAEEEINIKMEKARLEASLDVLHQRKEADAASAKADVMESVVAQFGMEEQCEEILGFLPIETTAEQKVSEYINKHGEAECNSFSQHCDLTPDQEEQAGLSLPVFTPLLVNQEPSQHHQLPQDRDQALQRPVTQQDAFPGVPQPQQRLNTQHCVVDSSTSDLTGFLAKIQQVTGALSKFDDKPESYLSWKVTFQTTVADVGLTANEEINLLIKWLGPKSSQHATRLKAVHIRRPSVALEMIWRRLEEVYGSPEAIENSLFSKIEKFPKLSRKDPQRLQELSDMVSELEAAKQDGYLPGLTYLDTSRGVGEIVDKLPFYLQEKWIMVGTKYKEDHGVAFPPFSFFCEFMKGQAKARNDPSFNSSSFSSQFHCHSKRTKAYKHEQKRKVCK
ncbi:uncharacterized protein LOC144033943 [Vanacampus margaritifer]